MAVSLYLPFTGRNYKLPAGKRWHCYTKRCIFWGIDGKGPTENEKRLLKQLCGETDNIEALYNHLCQDSPARMKPIGVKLLSRDTLTVEEAQKLGDYLFSDESGETFKGMAVSMLRIRYETDEEYEGLYKAVLSTFSPPFQETPLHLGVHYSVSRTF
jgi:hypothetical protein